MQHCCYTTDTQDGTSTSGCDSDLPGNASDSSTCLPESTDSSYGLDSNDTMTLASANPSKFC